MRSISQAVNIINLLFDLFERLSNLEMDQPTQTPGARSLIYGVIPVPLQPLQKISSTSMREILLEKAKCSEL